MPSESDYLAASEAWPGVVVPREEYERFVAARPGATSPSELYLCCACLRGDEAALRRFDEKFAPALRRALGRFDVDTDDVLQELRTHLFLSSAKLATFSGRGGLERWLRAVVVRLALKRKPRASSATLATDDFIAGDDPELAQMKDLYRAEFKTALGDTLGKLEPELQTCLRLYYLDNLGLVELAQLFGSSAPTISRRLSKAREEVLKGTRLALRDRLKVSPAELDSILRLIESKLEMTFSALE